MIGAVSRTRGYFTAAGVALALGLAACSGSDADPEPAPPPTSSSPSPADGPAAPTMPPAARGTDAASAEAFVRFYWEMVDYAQSTGDTSGLVDASDRCINCKNGVASIEKTYGTGGRIEGGQSQVTDPTTVFLDRSDGDWAVVQFRLTTSKQFVDLPGRDHDERYPGGRAEIRMILQPRSEGWVVRSMATR